MLHFFFTKPINFELRLAFLNILRIFNLIFLNLFYNQKYYYASSLKSYICLFLRS